MSTKKPQKRLVGWLEYLEQTSEKAEMYAFASVFGCVGAVLLLWSFIGILAGGLNAYQGDIGYALFVWTGSAVVAGLGLGALWCAKYLFREVKQTAPVALLTKASLNRLRDDDILVRASDPPPSNQQMELLRVAQDGLDTPAEQLVRASQENKDKYS